jgi:transcriptional regulator with XRE-family HTH domain
MTESDQAPDVFRLRLRHAREELRHMTQAELALKAQLPATSISHLEAGSRKPSFDNLKRIANALEVSTDFLMGRTEGPGDHVPDKLYRDLQSLSEADRETIRRFVESLGMKK